VGIVVKEGRGLGAETPRKYFENHALYFGYNFDQRHFFISGLYWKNKKKKQFLKARRTCLSLVGS